MDSWSETVNANERSMPLWVVWPTIFASIVLLGVVDWLTGYDLNFFVFYFLPVILAAWRVGLGSSIAVAVVCGFVWAGADYASGHTYSSSVFAVWNTLIRLTSFIIIAWLVSKIGYLIATERAKVDALRKALAEIKLLEGLLPICAQCKKIRDDKGSWRQMEAYIGEHANVRFSHGYCPECAKRALEEAGIDNTPA